MKLHLNEKHELNVHLLTQESDTLVEGFNAEKDQYLPLLTNQDQGNIYYGLGSIDELTTDELIHSVFQMIQKVRDLGITAFELVADEAVLNAQSLNYIFEAFFHDAYEFLNYRPDKTAKESIELYLQTDIANAQAIYQEQRQLFEGIKITRDFINRPPNSLYPSQWANDVVELFQDTEVDVRILDRQEMEALGMHSLLSVAQGSDQEARFMILKYLPLKDQEDHLTFVGKGVTYDSGGYALKPAASMDTMHSDMSGGASVIGLIHALQANQVQENVVGIVGAVENMVSGHAFKNGDIISSMKGTQIEVGNTDAEGRLVLADALYYAATQLNSRSIIDIATLTGACIVALGNHVTGLVSNHDDLRQEVLKASQTANEPMNAFTIYPTHREQVKGSFGQLKNATDGGAGAITAAVFLEHFVEETPWAHLDIAGPSYSKTAHRYLPAGASGCPVKTLYQFTLNQSKQ